MASRTQQTSDARWLAFAGVYLMIAGGLNVIWGTTALVNKEYFAEDGLLFSSLQFWGWIGILIGAIQIVVGAFTYMRRMVAQLIAMVLAMCGLLFSFTTVGAYPIWSCIALVCNALVLWAVTAHGMDG
ncbi:MAG TPA: hypothetical protein VFZ00_16415 [Solirubrobacter sp.]|nr:hypothetical protein [Solirubrobacter sp.]